MSEHDVKPGQLPSTDEQARWWDAGRRFQHQKSWTAALRDVLMERTKQDEKWGEQNHADHPTFHERGWWPAEWERRARDMEEFARVVLRPQVAAPSWAAILVEEVGEALQEDDPLKLRAELIQVAAVAVAWVECIDRRSKGGA